MDKVCIIGAGNMGGAIATGIACVGIFQPENIVVTAKTGKTLDKLKEWTRIQTSLDNVKAVEGADLVILAVKPWQLADVINEIKPAMDYGACTVVSVVAGVSFAELTEMFRKPVSGPGPVKPLLFRVIPNTAISLMQSTTFIAADEGIDPRCKAAITLDRIFGNMGEVFWVEEKMMSAGTSLASCGIAYAFKYMDAAIKGGVEEGFTQSDARDIVINTMKGALALLETNSSMPQTEIDKVTTPGGYTAKGLAAMEESGFTQAVIAGLKASI